MLELQRKHALDNLVTVDALRALVEIHVSIEAANSLVQLVCGKQPTSHRQELKEFLSTRTDMTSRNLLLKLGA